METVLKQKLTSQLGKQSCSSKENENSINFILEWIELEWSNNMPSEFIFP